MMFGSGARPARLPWQRLKGHFAASERMRERGQACRDLPVMLAANDVMPSPVNPVPGPGERPVSATLVETVHGRLVAGFDRADAASLDPLSELVGALLSHRRNDPAAARAFDSLRQRFGTWDVAMRADLAEIEAAIAGIPWAAQKAPRIRTVLLAIEARAGRLSLDFLAGMPAGEARAWLEQFPGIGPRTSVAVLAFSTLRMRALPVDSHHHRVAQRLGLIGPRVGLGPAHDLLLAQLPPEWTAQDLHDHHVVLARHGQDVCHQRRPACGRCALVDLCPSAVQEIREP